MEAVVLHRVLFLDYFCPKQGQDFKPSAAPVYPNMGKVPPPPLRGDRQPLGINLLVSMSASYLAASIASISASSSRRVFFHARRENNPPI